MLKKRALALTAVLALGLIPTLPSYAVTTYASPADLIEDVVEVALTGVTSSTYDAALAEMKGKVTLTDNTVSYNGTAIGYWTEEDSSTIYTTEYKNATVVEADGNGGWEVEPTVFDDILYDVNEDLIENVVPTTADWSKIIGKYDVSLGDLNVPADNWIELTPSANPLTDRNTFNVTEAYGSDNNKFYNDRLSICYYLIDNEGSLYIMDTYFSIRKSASSMAIMYNSINKNDSNFNAVKPDGTTAGTVSSSTYLYNRTGLALLDDGSVHPMVYLTDVTASNVAQNPVHNESCVLSHKFLKATDATLAWDPSTGYKEIGTFWVSHKEAFNVSAADTKALNTLFNTIYNSQSSSKKVVGNTTLTKRLSKLSQLGLNDTIVFTSTGWTVNGLDDLDSYISTATINEAGQSATMDGAVEIEELNFKVVVPSTLPMIADSEGNVTVASNATIANKSNAAVKISELRIDANPNSGWEMVAENPEKTRGANEFTFGTSLNIGDTIAKGQDLSFSYNADLSPAEEGVDSVDLVTLTITLDWAE